MHPIAPGFIGTINPGTTGPIGGGFVINPSLIGQLSPFIPLHITPAVSQQDRDMTFLLNGTFDSDAFTNDEVAVQTRLMNMMTAGRPEAVEPAAFRDALKAYVIEVVKSYVLQQRADGQGGNVPYQYWKDLGNIIGAYKSGDSSHAADVLHNSVIPNLALENQTRAVTDTAVIGKAASYLELSLAEAYKDCSKASNQGSGEWHSSSTMVDGGGGGTNNWGLVYKPAADGQGRNHFHMSNGELWYDAQQNSRGVAVALFNALARERLNLNSSADSDVKRLMNAPEGFDASAPFSSYEQTVQNEVVADFGNLPTSFGQRVKDWMIGSVQEFIRQQRAENQGGTMPVGYWQRVGVIIAGLKSGDKGRAEAALRGGPVDYSFANTDLADRVHALPDNANTTNTLKNIGAYLELSLAESYKDMVKASDRGDSQADPAATMASGGDAAWGMVCCQSADAGACSENHICGLSNSVYWHEGWENWMGVANGLFAAVAQAQLIP